MNVVVVLFSSLAFFFYNVVYNYYFQLTRMQFGLFYRLLTIT